MKSPPLLLSAFTALVAAVLIVPIFAACRGEGSAALRPNVSEPAAVDAESTQGAQVTSPSASSFDMSSSWLEQIREDLARMEYEAGHNSHGIQAPNRAHNFRTYFESRGIRVVDRTRMGSPDLLELRLSGIRRGERFLAAEPGEVSSDGPRVEIRRPKYTEWYINSAKGLEQGFTLSSTLPGRDPVELELEVRGARVRRRLDDLVFTTATGRRLVYHKLAVFDADGRPLKAWFGNRDPGRIQIILDDTDARYPITIDPLLTATYDSALESNQSFAQLGFSVSGAGDVNGDGYGDVIVGAPYYDRGAVDEGAAFLFLGTPSGVPDGEPAAAAAVLESNQAYAELGSSVAGAGDVNGDGFADVLVGAWHYSNPEIHEGAAFLFLGGPAGVADGDPATASAFLESNLPDADFGFSVSSAGDVNGDGYGDVIIGAPYYTDGESDEGAAFLFAGGAGGTGSGGTEIAWGTLQSDQVEAYFGWSVSGAGDVNGDGYSDVIVGARAYETGESGEGAAFVFHGNATGIADGNPLTANGILESDQVNATMGWSVSGAGDVNGDGYADVVVGARFYSAGEADEGAAFIYHGSASGIGNGTPATAAGTIESNQSGARLGESVSDAGDVNGDGYADIVVGAPRYDVGLFDEGAAFVFLGGNDGIGDGSPVSAPTTLRSNQIAAQIGASVSAAGDLNGDGFADLILGAPLYDAGSPDEGAAMLYLGGAQGIKSGTLSAASAHLVSSQPSSELGASVAGAGDINGDGYADLIIGAPLFDGGEPDEGAAFLLLGGRDGVVGGNPMLLGSTIESDQADAHLGSSVSAAGDVNGDGFGDVLVAAEDYDSGESNEGAVFVFLGAAEGIPGGDPGNAAALLESDQADAKFGSSVAWAGDVNGDGYGDVVIGAEKFDAGQPDEGCAFVFHGSAAGIPGGGPETAASVLESDQADAGMGSSVAGAADVNGDGYGDIIVGARSFDNGQADEGGAFIYLGGEEGIPDGGPGVAARVIESDQMGALLGGGVSSAGDVNGDGLTDVIVGSESYDAGEIDEGAAFLFLGSSEVPSGGNPLTANAVFEAGQAGARLGSSVAGAGDVNGDGYADVIIGAEGYGTGETAGGAAFVLLGAPGGWIGSGPGTAATTISSNDPDALLGSSVASLGDINGDGYSDVVVGARSYGQSGGGGGAAFVYLGNGGTSGRPVLARQTASGGAMISPQDSGLVQPWGLAPLADRVDLQITGTHPGGRGLVKIEVEYCPPGVSFGDGRGGSYTSPAWIEVGPQGGEVLLRETIVGLNSNTLYRWRARVLRAPLHATAAGGTGPVNPAHGPWRRLLGQAFEGDLRTPPGNTVSAPAHQIAAGHSILNVYPNPTRSDFTVSFSLPNSAPARLEMFDVSGRLIATHTVVSPTIGRHGVDFKGEPRISPGVYFLRLSQDSRQFSRRIVILP